MTAKAKPTMGSIWKVLSKIDCSDHVEEKNGYSYLSWVWAWRILMENFPQATFEFKEFDGRCHRRMPDGTASVECTVTIGENSREMFLSVMTGYKNMAKPDPTSRDICDAKMRCLVKCLGLFGLGFYIYAGEDLPMEAPEPTPNVIRKSGLDYGQPKSQLAVDMFSDAKYAFGGFQEMEDWVLAHKGIAVADLEARDYERIIDFFNRYKNRSDWPESVR